MDESLLGYRAQESGGVVLDSMNTMYNSLSLPLSPKLPFAFLRFAIRKV